MRNIGAGVNAQSSYYRDTGASYDAHHLHEGDAHSIGLRYVTGLGLALGARTVLDVGTGTGRTMKALSTQLGADARVFGIDPSRTLLRQAKIGSAAGVVRGSGTALPFADKSFDLVCESGALHHVPDPGAVVAEMLRVARIAVTVSDSNRFAQGSLAGRLLKLGLVRTNLWPLVMRIRTKGKGYLYSPGDGVFYSYSVWDSRPLVAAWAERVIVVDTSGSAGKSHLPLLLSAPTVLLCGVRESVAESGPESVTAGARECV
jgi:ubiquinone/menaquinone biosynthesis C-methylase UbiE